MGESGPDAAATDGPRGARVLLAPDKFKGTLSAAEVARHVRAGLLSVLPSLPVESLPVADGGDGTVAAALAAGFQPREARVTGPLGEPVTATWALREGVAVLEMAEASGLGLLPPGHFAPLTATTRGTGELIGAALDSGARSLVLGVGGSATTDAGTGMLSALGARFTDAGGCLLPPGGGALARLAAVDLGGLDPRLAQAEIVLASDVDNPLTGPRGAALVYGPQKGANPEEAALLDAALGHCAEVLGRALGPGAARLAEAPGAGAAGGLGYGALAGLGAVFRPGIEVLLEVLGFGAALARCSLVVTGEGSLDAQTLHGKAPAGVAAAARAAGRETVAVCGRLALGPEQLAGAGIARAYALAEVEPDLDRCLAAPGPLLEQLGARIARDFLTGTGTSA
ncbi:glycerate kinase [Streptomyces albus]|uniref:Glycerate kinase n=1 Tax=Streptomyces albus (strain ATCC 21838 / DSM 41398 / FERM P-419 / JCM 4703 / NBRC 107858) TaxID=1081613 RepID=A0A0B5ERV1_STRA4|nr:glycerate kinase [Streptomyces albus]AOU75159.1 glycerate kinase [Streptomyces albus]AYN30964.1 glycerate kinase [Streptomyces albus]